MFRQYPQKSSLDNQRGRYKVGGKSEVTPKKIGWWERDLSKLTPDITDIIHVITKEQEFRPDIVSELYYQRSTLTWLVLQYNNIIDINEEFKVGRTIMLPSAQRAMFDITI